MGDNLESLDFGEDFQINKLVVGSRFGCVLSVNGTIKCWGRNGVYQLGDGTNNHRGDDPNEMGNDLVAVDLGSNFLPINIECGGWHVCSMSIGHEVKCWGKCLHLKYEFLGRNDLELFCHDAMTKVSCCLTKNQKLSFQFFFANTHIVQGIMVADSSALVVDGRISLVIICQMSFLGPVSFRI